MFVAALWTLLTLAVRPLGWQSPAQAASPRAAALLVWHLSPPLSATSLGQATEVSTDAPATLGFLCAALGRHPRTKVNVVADRSFLEALQRAGAGDALLDRIAARNALESAELSDLIDMLARTQPVSALVAGLPAGRRYAALMAGARLELQGDRSIRFSQRDFADAAGLAAFFRLVESGDLTAASPLMRKATLTAVDLRMVALAAARADARVYNRLRRLARMRAVEIVASPTWEPVLPLLIDAAGKSDIEPNAVHISAEADAARLVGDGIAQAAQLNGSSGAGVYSPYGAYDDATAASLREQHAAYALFSDRVLEASEAGGSAEAAKASALGRYRAYAVQTGKITKLGAFFWDERASVQLNSLPGSLPPSALGARVAALARSAAAAGQAVGHPNVIIVRMDALGPWERRDDAASVIDGLISALGEGSVAPATTFSGYLTRYGTSETAYGFPPASGLGSFDLWMGSAAQAALWSALQRARASAGGNAAMQRGGTTGPLAQAEAARWFSAPVLAQGRQASARATGRFRALLGQVYRSAGRAPAHDALGLRSRFGSDLPRER